MCRRPPLLRSEIVRRDSAGPTLAARSAGRTHGNTAVGSRISGAFWIAPRVGRRTHLYVSRRANNKVIASKFASVDNSALAVSADCWRKSKKWRHSTNRERRTSAMPAVVSALRPDLAFEVAAMAVPIGARRVAPSDHDERGRA